MVGLGGMGSDWWGTGLDWIRMGVGLDGNGDRTGRERGSNL